MCQQWIICLCLGLFILLLQHARVIGTGTFGCGTTIVEGEDFIAENITFENSSPQVMPKKFYVAPTPLEKKDV